MAFFYADGGLLAFPRPARIQAVLDVLEEMLDMVDIHTNIDKTVGMVSQPYYIVDRQSETAYTRWMMVVGAYFRGRQREIILCPYC